jgi:hypothetical protein
MMALGRCKRGRNVRIVGEVKQQVLILVARGEAVTI